MMDHPSFLLGVNYWPRKKAMYWWKDFDRSEVEREFAEIAALRLRVVRIFLLWEDFQPAPDQMSQKALANLGQVLDVAQELGLQVMPTFFTGFMSGVSWWPNWALADHEDPSLLEDPFAPLQITDGRITLRVGRDIYNDPELLAAQQLFVSSVCARFGQHPAIYAWDWGNEHDIFFRPKTYADGVAWQRLLAATARRFSSAPITFGQHFPILLYNNGFRADYQAQVNDLISMHAYSIYYDVVANDNPLNSDVVPLASLAVEALSGRPVLFQEFGYASSEHGDRSEYRIMGQGTPKEFRQYFADDRAGGIYYQEVLEKLLRCGSTGAIAWMFSDYDPSIWHLPPFNTHEHERFFGLTRADGTVKPSGMAMRAVAERLANEPRPPRTVPPLTLNANEWYAHPHGQFDRLFQAWRGKL